MAEDGNHHFGAVDETTKRLVGRCGRVGWLQQEGESPGSPTKLKQRLLSVSMPSAMESSLSVVEVAAQTSKPGVKTPSRAADEGAKGAHSADAEAAITNKPAVQVTGENGGGGSTANGSGIGAPKSPFEVEGEA